MARPRKPAQDPPAPAFAPELLDALAADLKTPADLDALFRQMKKALVERALGAEPARRRPARSRARRPGR